MSDTPHINATNKETNPDRKSLFIIVSTIIVVFSANYVLGLNEKIEADSNKIDQITASLASLNEQISQGKEQINTLTNVAATNTGNITLLAENTKTKVASVRRSIVAVSKDVVAVRSEIIAVNNDIVEVSNKVKVVEKKASSIDERTRAIEQAVDMPGTNPLDYLITNYEQ